MQTEIGSEGNNMKKLSFLFLFILLTVAYADSPPQMPGDDSCTFYGEAYIDNSPAVNGTKIEAYIESTKFAEVIMDRSLLYTIEIPADDPATVEKEGGINGEIVKFFIEDNFAGFGEFEKDKTKLLNLNSSSQLTIVQPQEGKNLNTLPILLEWYGGNPPYSIIVSKYQDYRDPAIQEWNLAYNYYNIHQLEKGTYYWKVIDARNDFDESYFTYLSSNPDASITIHISGDELIVIVSTTPRYVRAYLYTDTKKEIELTKTGNKEYTGSFKADGGVIEAIYEDIYGNYCRDFEIIGGIFEGTKYQELKKKAKENGFDDIYSYVEYLEEEVKKNSVELFEYEKAKEKFKEGETLLSFIERLEKEASDKDTQIKTLNEQIDDLNDDKEDLQSEIDKLKENKQDTTELEEKLNQKEKEIEKLNEDKSSLKQQVSALKKALNMKNLITIGAMIFGIVSLLTAILILVKKKGAKKLRVKEKPKVMSKKKIIKSLLKHDHVQVTKEETKSIEKKEGKIKKTEGENMKAKKTSLDISLEIDPQIVRPGQKTNLKIYVTNFSLKETAFDLVVDHKELEFEGSHVYTNEVEMRSAETVNFEIEVSTDKVRPGKKLIYVSAISEEQCLATAAIELYVRTIPEAR